MSAIEKGIGIALFLSFIFFGTVFGIKAIDSIFDLKIADTVFAEDSDHQGYCKTEYVECPVNIKDIHIAYLPADLSGLDSFQQDAARLAQVIYGEARGLKIYDKSMVAWCVLNRKDMGLWGDTLYSVISSPYQFNWKNNFPVTEEDYRVAADVLMRYEMEQCVLGDIGRTLPKQFVNFRGNGKENIFKDRNGNTYSRWLEDPYD